MDRIAHSLFRAKRQPGRGIDVSRVVLIQREQGDVDDLGGLYVRANLNRLAAEKGAARDDLKLGVRRARERRKRDVVSQTLADLIRRGRKRIRTATSVLRKSRKDQRREEIGRASCRGGV